MNAKIRWLVNVLTSSALACAFGPAMALGHVSRSCAAAGAQESITVDWGFQSYWMLTTSTHYRDGRFLHHLGSGWENTWRSDAGHLGSEFFSGEVWGNHSILDEYGREKFLGISHATDCNLGEWGTE